MSRPGFALPAALLLILVLGMLLLPLLHGAVVESVASHAAADAAHARRAAESVVRALPGRRWDEPIPAAAAGPHFDVRTDVQPLAAGRVLVRVAATGQDRRRAAARADAVLLRLQPELLLAWLVDDAPPGDDCGARLAWLQGALLRAGRHADPPLLPFLGPPLLLDIADVIAGGGLDLDDLPRATCDAAGCSEVPVVFAPAALHIQAGRAVAVILVDGNVRLAPDARLEGALFAAGTASVPAGSVAGLVRADGWTDPGDGDACAAVRALAGATAMRRFLAVDDRILLPIP
jgi:hypothetical protein